MAWQWKFLADLKGTPGDVSLYGPAWAPQRNVPALADLNTFKVPGVHRITTPDTQTISNIPVGMSQAGIFENLLTGTGTDVWWVQRITQHGNAPRMWWRSTRDLAGTWNDWRESAAEGGTITEVHAFLAVGQSNMSGRGAPSGGSRDPETPRIMQYGATVRTLRNATVPLDMLDSQTATMNLSPATTFARAYLKTQPPHVGVLIIPAAYGGTAFTNSTTVRTWTPNVATDPAFDLPALAVAQTVEAITAAKSAGYTVSLEGILWHQGEGNGAMSQSTYSSSLDGLIGYLRSGLGDSRLPFIVGQMAPEGIDLSVGRQGIDAAHRDTPNRVAYTGFAPSTRGGHNAGDTTHLSRIGVEFLGRTYAEALMEAKASEDVKPRLKTVETSIATIPAQVSAAVAPAVAEYVASDPSIIEAAADLAANNTGLLSRWKPNTPYTAGQQVATPDGDVVTRTVSGTTGPTFTMTNWAPSATATTVATKLDASQKGAASGVAPLGSDLKIPAANMPTPFVRGDDGVKYRVVAGVLRNTGAPNYWQFIDDTGHHPIGVASVTSDASQITVNYSFTASKAGTFIVTPDETMAVLGFTCGASVGLDNASIKLSRSRTLNSYVYYDGSAWQSSSSNFVVSNFTAGTLTLTHETMLGVAVTVSGRGPATRPMVSDATDAIAATQTLIKFYDPAGALLTTPTTGMKVYVTRIDAVGGANPQTVIDTTSAPFHNLWFYGIHQV